MQTCRNLLIALVAAAILIAAAPAAAGSGTVRTTNAHAVYTLDTVGGVSDVRTTASVRACDDGDPDGYGVIAYAWKGETGDKLLARAVARKGTGTCGKPDSFHPKGTFRVEVCLHDKDGNKDQSGLVRKCKEKVIR